MIKLVILGCFLALIFAQNITFPPPQCDSTYYGNTDEACDNNLKRCKNFYVCKNGKCKRAHIGSECADNTDCFGWKEENLRCINKKCIKPRYPGYSCVDSGECWTGACVGGLCSGKQQGADCNPNNLAECDYGLYCSLAQKKCVPQLRLLQSCNDYAVQDDIPQGANYNIMCPGGSVCMGRSGAQSCRPYRNGDLGDACNAERNGNEECKFGLTCSWSRNICIQPNPPESFACVGSRNCSVSAGETCTCDNGNTNVGLCRTRTDRVKCDLISASNAYTKCMAESNCAYEKNFIFSFMTDGLDKNTCLGYYCGDIARKYLCCAYIPYRGQKWSQAAAGPLQCGDFASTGGRTAAIIFLVIFILALIGASFTTVGIAVYSVIQGRRSAGYESV